MQPSVAQHLIELNRRFYTDFGEPFSATRGRVQPGVRRVLDSLTGDESILDLGCGNGELARTLARLYLRHRRGRDGHGGAYLGLDYSLPLLADAESVPEGFSAKFREVDLTQLSAISDQLLATGGPPTGIGWSLITAFAVLHHIPSRNLRLNLLETIRELLADDGRFVHSNWQFLNSPRLRQRVREWSEASLTEADVDQDDYLLDWRSGGTGLRYVHHFSERELAELAESSGFRMVETFYSDGKEGNLAIYQTWQK